MFLIGEKEVGGLTSVAAQKMKENMSDLAEENNPASEKYSHGRVRKFFANLGPGLITGAADDDPSGISTYSTAGAAFGYLPLWMAPFAFPLIVLVILLTGNPKIMGNCVSSRPLRYLGWATAAIMSAAAVGMFLTM